MIQRIQSVYLFLAFVLSIVSVAMFSTSVWFANGGTSLVSAVYHVSYPVLGCLFPFFLLVSGILSVVCIFGYKNRKRQTTLVLMSQLSIIGAFLVFLIPYIADRSLQLEWSAIVLLPLFAFIFNMLARKAIIKDEKLVRSTDRIR